MMEQAREFATVRRKAGEQAREAFRTPRESAVEAEDTPREIGYGERTGRERSPPFSSSARVLLCALLIACHYAYTFLSSNNDDNAALFMPHDALESFDHTMAAYRLLPRSHLMKIFLTSWTAHFMHCSCMHTDGSCSKSI